MALHVPRRQQINRLFTRFSLFVLTTSLSIFLFQHHLLLNYQNKDLYELSHGYYDVAVSDVSRFIDAATNDTKFRRTSSDNAIGKRKQQVSKKISICNVLNRTVRIPSIPHFIIAGAQKSGTTALQAFLSEHPNIQMSATSEPHFFDWHYPSPIMKDDWLKSRQLPLDIPDSDFQCAIREAYSESFRNSTDPSESPQDSFGLDFENKIFFEKTPSYLFLTKVPQNIKKTCPWNPKIIVILRNPVDRAFSHFRMGLRTGRKSFEALIDEEMSSLRALGLSNAPQRSSLYEADDSRFDIPDLPQSEMETVHWKHYRRMFTKNFVQRGMYITQLRHWMKFFPLGESLLVLNYESFTTKPEKVFAELLDFVGASPFVPSDGFGTQHNSHGPPEKPIIPSTRKFLSALFRPYNDLLADELGEDWRDVWS